MFGDEQVAHDTRYELADEFTGMMETLGLDRKSDDERAEQWRMIDAFVTPKPRFARPLLVNATGSTAGIAYAARHSDLVLISSPGGGHVDAAMAARKAQCRDKSQGCRTRTDGEDHNQSDDYLPPDSK